MCVLIYHTPEKKIKKEEMEKHSFSNPHGFGYMFINNNNNLVIQKFMNKDAFITSYLSEVEEYPSSPFTIHFRYGTCGKKNIENCHPFKICNNIGMAHNGIFNDIKSTDEFSDTYIFNRDILSKIGENIFNKSVKILLETSIGSNNKVVIMNNKKQFHIFNSGLGEWDDGAWRSFKSYKSELYNNSNHSLVEVTKKDTCCKCKKQFIDSFLYTITTPGGFKGQICTHCLTKTTYISDVVPIYNRFYSSY